ncbi:MAG TPA: nucleotidyltransferase family protein [archaeon]|nr:nucleotidyltransferase family protein [archaeon]
MNKKIEGLKTKVLPVLKQHGVVKAGLFGSIVRNEETEGSDIDILVQFRKGKTLLDLIGLERELKTVLGREVDIVTYNSINHLLKQRILDEEVRLM